jgi:hypothetical protein
VNQEPSPARRPPFPLCREVLSARRAASPVGALVLSTATIILALAASSVLLRDSAVDWRLRYRVPPTLAPLPPRMLSEAELPPPPRLRPATPCSRSRSSQPLRPMPP